MRKNIKRVLLLHVSHYILFLFLLNFVLGCSSTCYTQIAINPYKSQLETKQDEKECWQIAKSKSQILKEQLHIRNECLLDKGYTIQWIKGKFVNGECK